jgi:hypothetical protein
MSGLGEPVLESLASSAGNDARFDLRLRVRHLPAFRRNASNNYNANFVLYLSGELMAFR